MPGDPTFLPLLHRLRVDVSIPNSALRCAQPNDGGDGSSDAAFKFGLYLPDMRMAKAVAQGPAGGAAFCIRLANEGVPWIRGVNVLAEVGVSCGSRTMMETNKSNP